MTVYAMTVYECLEHPAKPSYLRTSCRARALASQRFVPVFLCCVIVTITVVGIARQTTAYVCWLVSLTCACVAVFII